jgi:hypothetical protein
MLIFIIQYSSFLYSQDDFICGTEPPIGESIDLNQLGGIYLTSQGTIKVLVVFARFKNDNTYHPYWPVDGDPVDYTEWIDPDMQTGSTNIENFTHYFKEMSMGVYTMIGTAVSVEAPRTKQEYGSNYGLANREVLQQVVDPIINFNEFDNWTCNANYNHSNQSDGTIDFIFMIWRASNTSYYFGNWTGEASLGYISSYTVENGAKTIKASFGCGAGSGVTVMYWGEKWPKYAFHAAVHEAGHWLLGGSHPYNNSTGPIHNVWGILWASSFGVCANAYERERLAWIYPIEITGDVLNAPFTDYVTTGTAYKYHPPNGATNEYYYFENHQRLHVYDDATSNPNDKGIFVIHQQGPYSSTNNIRLKTSNGQWNWQNPFSAECFDQQIVPAFKPLAINRAGYNNRDRIPKSGGGTEWLFALINKQDVAVCGDWLHGGGLNNNFNLSYNDVFSPYSNPFTHTWNYSQNDFTMEVFNQSGSTVNAKFYLTNPLAGKPSKPQHIRITLNPQFYPVVTWEANLEPDMPGGQYKVWRAFTTGGEPTTFSHIATINVGSVGDKGPAAYSWTDFSVCGAGSGSARIYYTISAVDNTSLESVRADHDWVPWNQYLCKEGQGSEDKIIVSEYKLYINFPNPFNPQTTIQYDIKETGLVKLKVYDVLGKEVMELVNEVKEDGKYFITFNAENLPSGIYIYSIHVNDFTANHKMILLK